MEYRKALFIVLGCFGSVFFWLQKSAVAIVHDNGYKYSLFSNCQDLEQAECDEADTLKRN